MWNSHRLLNFVSNTLFAMTAAGLLYALALHYDLPRFLPLKEIHIQGIHTERAELKHITYEQIEWTVKNEIKGNFLSVDLKAVRDAFAGMPWVRDVKVERTWPLGLIVKLEEHQVLAHWGSHALVNTQGEVFRASLDENFTVFTAPMEANAQEVAENYLRFNQILAPLKQSIAKINLSSRHAWRIELNTGTILELGRKEMEERLMRYVAVYNHSLVQLNLEAPLAYVDLRYPNGFAVLVSDLKKPLKGNSSANKDT